MSSKAISYIVGTFIAVVLILSVLSFFVERVEEGHVAVVYTPKDGAKEVLPAGMHIIGLLEKTYEFSVRQEVIETKVDVNTSDGKKVTIPVTYNLRIDEGKALDLFKLYGARGEKYYSEVVIQQQLQKTAKATISNYSTIEIFTGKMEEAGKAIGEVLSNAVSDKGLFVSEIALLSPELDAATQAAIDAQVQAQQENELKKLQAENDKIDQQRAQQQAEADQKKRQTEADTKAYETQKAAAAEAEANKLLSQSLTDPVLRKLELEARLKHGWIEIQGGTVITDATDK